MGSGRDFPERCGNMRKGPKQRREHPLRPSGQGGPLYRLGNDREKHSVQNLIFTEVPKIPYVGFVGQAWG